MKRTAFLCFLGLCPMLAHAAGEKAVLVVTVQHISSEGGDLRLALYDRKSFADDDAAPVTDKVVAAKPWNQVVTFAPVPPGTYAVKMFQDYNRNQKFDFDWFGIPAERYGFSNNAGPDWLHLAPPSFEDAKIVLKPGLNPISIWLH